LARLVLDALKTAEEVTVKRDRVYYGVYEDAVLVYFYHHDQLFAIGDDKVYPLGQIGNYTSDAEMFKDDLDKFLADLGRMSRR